MARKLFSAGSYSEQRFNMKVGWGNIRCKKVFHAWGETGLIFISKNIQCRRMIQSGARNIAEK